MEGGDKRLVELIRAGCMAGAYSSLARREPKASRGMMKLNAKWRERVKALADDVAATAVG